MIDTHQPMAKKPTRPRRLLIELFLVNIACGTFFLVQWYPDYDVESIAYLALPWWVTIALLVVLFNRNAAVPAQRRRAVAALCSIVGVSLLVGVGFLVMAMLASGDVLAGLIWYLVLSMLLPAMMNGVSAFQLIKQFR